MGKFFFPPKQTNKREGQRIESRLCSRVAQKLCQDCHDVFVSPFFFSFIVIICNWMELRVEMSAATQMHSMSSWHLHVRSVRGKRCSAPPALDDSSSCCL